MVRRIVFASLIAILILAGTVSHASANPPVRKVFTVSPTGVDDTANILKAFADAQASGPGATVQFTAGTFITDLIHVVNFNGFVKGKSQEKTIITARADLSCQAEADLGFVPSLFRFTEGNIQVSDLTLQIANPDPCAPYNFSWWGSDNTTWLYAGFTFGGPVPVDMTECGFYKNGKVDATVDRVSVIIGDGVVVVSAISGGGDFVIENSCNSYGYNVDTRLKVTRSYFTNAMMADLSVQNVDGGNLVFTGNTLYGSAQSFFIADIAHAPVLISDNNIENPGFAGIFLAQGLYPSMQVPVAPAQFIVRNNTIKILGGANGVLFFDNTAYLGENEIPRMNILVEKNQIIQDGQWTDGVIGLGVHNARVLNNRFTGQGYNAILMGVGSYPDVGWLISGNDIRTLQPYPPATSMDKIVLGPLSSDCRVVTGSTDDVLDQGANNVIIGGHRHNGGHAPTFHLPPAYGRHIR